MRIVILSLVAAGLSAMMPVLATADGSIDAYKTLRGSEIGFSLRGNYSNATLSISGPNGFYTQTYSKTGSASIDLIRAGATAEGQYTYELSVATGQTVYNANPMDNGRGGVDKPEQPAGASVTGTFYAKDGLIVEIDSQQSESE